MLPRDKMTDSARLLRDTYATTPGARLFRREFGYMEGVVERWQKEGLDPKANFSEVFSYDPPGNHGLGRLGWCEAAFAPAFEDKIVEDRGDHEVYQDYAGRRLLVFKGRRQGFMPEYINHPVKDMKTWVEDVRWRLDPKTPERWANFEKHVADAKAAAGRGLMIQQNVIGGYMYLRSLIGPMDLMYAWYDMPDVVHDCMKTWLELADAVTARFQQHLTLDELFFGEDICYNHGPLCSPAMMREFILPYYRQLKADIRSRQIDKSRHMYFQIDTDGFADPVIPIYRESCGMDVMSPFEVASRCDVVRTSKEYPDLVMFGGIDKRILAQGKKAIDRMVERILPPMRARGGYIPTCDHSVPLEVPLENYRHYRKRCLELGG
ncbi:MAG TPA: uroporphyrinogen decarboxylase family protein [Phycisphaerae bacterium]|nr:uroporphyrinogen decarboxylase family protein [Phycisphaerae bacterium]